MDSKIHSLAVTFLHAHDWLFTRSVGPVIDAGLDYTCDRWFDCDEEIEPTQLFHDAVNTSALNSSSVLPNRRLLFSPSWLSSTSTQLETTMTLASFVSLLFLSLLLYITFLSCFQHSLLTSPMFNSTRRHRLPNLVPVPLPRNSFTGWIKICFYMSDEEIVTRVGYDSLIFLRFHRLALRCLLKISVFSFFVLLPVNYGGGEHERNEDDYGYMILTDFTRFTMANVAAGSPRLWIHCAGAYLLTIIFVQELLREYSDYNTIRHRYLLSRCPHLRTVLVTMIPAHMRSKRKITAYFKNMYPDVVTRVSLCENLIYLESLIKSRTWILERLERITYLIAEKDKLAKTPATFSTIGKKINTRFQSCFGYDKPYYKKEQAVIKSELADANELITKELKRRSMIMHHLDKMGAATGSSDIDYLLSKNGAHPAANPLPPQTQETVSDPDALENHLNEVTDKAFVSFSTYTAATIAMQSMHGSKPGVMAVEQAPEPRAILFENIYVTSKAARTRHILGNAFVAILIGCYAIPTTLISLLVSEAALVSYSPVLARLVVSSGVFTSLTRMVQPLCIVALQQTLPPLFLAMSKIEGQLSFCDVQIRAFSRYFAFQVVNIFLVTAIAGSIFETMALIAENPGKVFQLLGYALPKTSSFFCYYIILKSSLGLGVELVRVVPIIQGLLRLSPLCHHNTLRDRRKVIAGIRPIDDPGWMPIHKVFAQDMLVVVIGVVFAVIAPLVLIPCLIFCLISRIVWTHQFLYVYESCCESGGQFWPKVFRRFVFGIAVAQATVVGQFMLKGAWSQAYVTIILMISTYFYLKRARSKYDMSSSSLPLEIAAVMDINVDNNKAELPYPPQLMDLKDVLKEKDENLMDYLMGDTVGRSDGKCTTTPYEVDDLDKVEKGWDKVLQDQTEQSTGIFNKIGVGLDGGTLKVPDVELMKRKSGVRPTRSMIL
ncbi:hypothetical protein TrLO_g12663 [Triparma laevis f. longispina]|uniref:Uncharacterized protein n=1 Tax=Triparma laevis f. longispina TaxID=1714387 RepID=A0A9W7CPI0_9STRA|nr:hypothetical protein TrLO_g12663 [Triparma laevis f. longispina]